MMKKILKITAVLLMLSYTGALAMEKDCIWLQHLPEKNELMLQKLTYKTKLSPIGVTEDGKKNFGQNFGLKEHYIDVLTSLPELIGHNTSENPYNIYTFGCGSTPIFELHCILAGLHDGKQKIKVSMSDIQRVVIQKGTQYVFDVLKKLKENKLQMPEIKNMYNTAVSRIPDDMDKKCYPDGNADLIVASSVVHFLGEKEICPFFDNAYKKSKPGGRLFVAAEAPRGEYVDLYVKRESEGCFCPGLLKTNAIKAVVRLKQKGNVSTIPTETPILYETVVPMTEEESPGDINTIEEPYRQGKDLTMDQALENGGFFEHINKMNNTKISFSISKKTDSFCFNYLTLPVLKKIGEKSGFSVLKAQYVKGIDFFKEDQVTNEMFKKETDKTYNCLILFQKPL